jgi:hypothetical protein
MSNKTGVEAFAAVALTVADPGTAHKVTPDGIETLDAIMHAVDDGGKYTTFFVPPDAAVIAASIAARSFVVPSQTAP